MLSVRTVIIHTGTGGRLCQPPEPELGKALPVRMSLRHWSLDMALLMSRTHSHPEHVICSIYFHSGLSTPCVSSKTNSHTVSRSAEFSSRATTLDLGMACTLVTNLNSNNASVWIQLVTSDHTTLLIFHPVTFPFPIRRSR